MHCINRSHSFYEWKAMGFRQPNIFRILAHELNLKARPHWVQSNVSVWIRAMEQELRVHSSSGLVMVLCCFHLQNACCTCSKRRRPFDRNSRYRLSGVRPRYTFCISDLIQRTASCNSDNGTHSRRLCAVRISPGPNTTTSFATDASTLASEPNGIDVADL